MRNTRDTERDYEDSKGDWYVTIRVASALDNYMLGQIGPGWQTTEDAIHSYGTEQLEINYGTKG